MTLYAPSNRSRVAALAAGLALSLSVVAAPVVADQDDGPESVVQGLLADIEASDFEAIGGWFCEAFADQAAAFDMSAIAANFPPGIDTAGIFDAFDLDVAVESIETISETDNEAIVKLVATLAMDIDVTALEPVIVALLEAGGQEATPDMVQLVGGMMASEIGGESLEINEEITVVRSDDGTWGQICSELGADDSDMDDGEGTADMDAEATDVVE